MNYVSLFTGIGGFDLALDRAGHTAVAMVERDKACQGVLRRHFPGVPLFDDVTTFGKKDIPDATVDIVCGGSPCQSFSVAGLRKSLADQRGNLAFEFCRIVNELKPAYVIWENVPGVLNTKDNAFGCFLAALVGEDAPLVPHRGRWTNAGLVAGPERSAAWRVLDAQYFGVAQRRRRVFVVASAASADKRCDEILFECEGVRRDTAPSRQARKGAAGFTPSSIGGYTEGLGTLRANGGDNGGGSEQLIAYNIQHNDGGEHKRKDRPNGGMYVQETDTALTVGTTDLTAIIQQTPSVDISPSLKCEGADASEDGSGRHAFVVQQNTRDEVRLVGGDGQIAGAISAEAGMKQQNYVVQQNDIVGPLRGNVYNNSDPTMEAQQLVIQQNAVGDPDTANSVDTKVRHDYDNQVGTAIVAFNWQSGGDVRHAVTETPNLQANQTPAILHNATVRRLTPTEAERLQAFPDGWTEQRYPLGKNWVEWATERLGSVPSNITPTDNQEMFEIQADTPRYKQLGNAVCVNVVEWIARRIPA